MPKGYYQRKQRQPASVVEASLGGPDLFEDVDVPPVTELPAFEATKPPSTPPTFESSNQESANRAQETLTRQFRTQRDNAPESLVVLPGGITRNLYDVVDAEFIPGNHRSIFQEPEDYLKAPEPGFHYVWAASKDEQTFANVRAGYYEPVDLDEIRDDTAVPISTHKIGSTEYVAIRDLILMKVSPRAWRQLYKAREDQAIMRTARNQGLSQLSSNLQQFGGQVQADSAVKVVDG
jgi:hypothetical protein